jgi:hypothetical protein
MANKRAKDLSDALSKAGAYILIDKAGWVESLRFPANLLALLTDLTNYLNKSSDLITQADAEAGISSTAQSWSSIRVRQAIIAWYATVEGRKDITFIQESDKNANFEYTIPGNSRLETIDFNYVSGTPTVKIGTSAGGEDVLFEHIIDSLGETNVIPRNVPVDLLLHVSVSGGTVTPMFGYRENFWMEI